MKKILSALTFIVLLTSIAFNQVKTSSVDLNFTPINRTLYQTTFNANRATSVCFDTNEYTMNKATGLQALSINNSTSGSSAGQYYDCPQPIAVSGMEFYAYSSSLPNVVCYVEIYLAGPDSLPTGAALASMTVNIDSSFGGGSLDTLKKTIVFPSPVIVSSPYILVFNNNSNNNVALLCNNYTAADGNNENIGLIKIATSWLHGQDVNIGPNKFDGDWIFSPYTQTNISSRFTYDTYCIPDSVNFTNQSSVIFGNKMYNLAANFGMESLSYSWNFGDATPALKAVDTGHRYLNSGPFTVSLHDTLYGWKNSCYTDTSIILDGRIAKPQFKDSLDGLTVYFTDTTNLYLDTPTNWLWDFGDGNVSSQQNPTHTYASSGNYTVCFVASGNCGTDSTCKTVNITTVGLDEVIENYIHVFPNPATNKLTISANEVIYISDITGRNMGSYNLTQNKTIDISKFTSGIYFIKNTDGLLLTKFFKD